MEFLRYIYLNITFVMNGRSTLHIYSILHTQPPLRSTNISIGLAYTSHLLSALPPWCINTLYYIYRPT